MTAVQDAHTATPGTDEDEPQEPERRRRGWWWSALVATLIVAGAGAWLWARDAADEPAPVETGPVATAVVGRGTISATGSWDGTVDHGTPVTVTGTGEGTVTRLPDQGGTIEPGGVLFHLDEQPVTLLDGVVPMYRDLAAGDSGTDVAQLEDNLVALGYDGFTPDDVYTPSTGAAVRAWQDDIGADPTGSVPRSAVVFLPEGGRVDSLRVDVGASVRAGTPVLDLTGVEQVASLEAPVDDRDRFTVGTPVTVVLPGGDEVTGTVATMAVVGIRTDAGEGAGGGATEPDAVVQVEIALDGQVSEELVGAPVDVIVATDERRDVLTVPVSALLALAEGGYGLEVVDASGETSLVAVTTGLFGDGQVEIDGDDIAEGTVVGVAGR